MYACEADEMTEVRGQELHETATEHFCKINNTKKILPMLTLHLFTKPPLHRGLWHWLASIFMYENLKSYHENMINVKLMQVLWDIK